MHTYNYTCMHTHTVHKYAAKPMLSEYTGCSPIAATLPRINPAILQLHGILAVWFVVDIGRSYGSGIASDFSN